MSGSEWQRAVLGDVSAADRAAEHDAARVHVPSGAPVSAAPDVGMAAAADVPVQPPAPVPALPPAAAALAPKNPRRGDSAARRTTRALRDLFASSAARDVEQATRIAQALQQPVTTGRQIVVTSIRGGAGKTTLAALLGSTYAHYRPDPVLVMEANPTLGTLPVRLGASSLRWSVGDLARVIAPSMRFDQVIGYLVGLPEGGWLLPGSKGQIGAQVTLEAYQKVAVALRRYFAVTVVDSETLPGELARSAMAGAQARVLATPATVEGVASARAVLEWMGSLPRPMLPGTVVALTETSPHTALDRAKTEACLRVGDVEVVTVPYDRHVAGGGPIRLGMLGRRTREAAALLGAQLLSRAVRR